jgi:hemolysin III
MTDRIDTLREEIASALIHGVAAAAALAGSAVLITLAVIYGDAWAVTASTVFGISLLLLYVASTLYHAIQHPIAKGRLQVFDHCAIYLLIAGTYTPFTLLGLRGPLGWWMFGTIWALALAGVVFKLFYTGRFHRLSLVLYVAMGWLVVVAVKPVMQALDTWSFGWLIGGGVAYTLGVYFYRHPRLRACDLAHVRDRRQRLPLCGGAGAGPAQLNMRACPDAAAVSRRCAQCPHPS